MPDYQCDGCGAVVELDAIQWGLCPACVQSIDEDEYESGDYPAEEPYIDE